MKYTYDYPLLEKISELYESDKGSFVNTHILACQHILESQVKMFELISDFGIPKENIYIFGKIYSTSQDILGQMISDNFKVSKPVFNPGISFDVEHNGICRNELEVFLASIKNPSKIIILDDGGELLKVVNDAFGSVSRDVSVVGIEQTSSGFRKLENVPLKFPVFNVARSAVKLIKESPLIADLGYRRISDVIVQYSILEPRVLVVGLGPLGSRMLSIFNDNKYFVIGYDIAHHDEIELVDLIVNNKINIAVGVTGSTIMNSESLLVIKSKLKVALYLISMSSADREFPATYIRENGVSTQGIHVDVILDNIVLINNGFPITFKGNRYESTPQEIERTIGLLFGSALEATIKNFESEAGFMEVPDRVTNLIEKYE